LVLKQNETQQRNQMQQINLAAIKRPLHACIKAVKNCRLAII